jgi:amino acid adenylation domain-containing protein
MHQRLLQHWISHQAQKRPEAVALVSSRETTSYGRLEELSNRLARILKENGLGRGDRVGLLLPKSPAAIIAIAGVLKADAIYVPLDPSSPATRLAKILESCENRWLLAAGGAASLLDQLFRNEKLRSSISVGWLGAQRAEGENFRAKFSLDDLSGYPGAAPDSRNRPQDPAHILFTSGSTGMPKGVVITHSNVIHFVEWARRAFGMESSDRNSSHPPLHFDLSTFDVFGTFAAGAELHLVPPELNLFPNKLADFIRSSELTQWFSVPSVLNYMAKFDVVKPDDFPALRRLLWCGEVLPTPALIYWMKRLPHVRFTNLYGPTEATIASSYYTVPELPADERAAIPIGAACEGEELLVLDDALKPVEPEKVGDLYIGGVGLSPGYWRDEEKTRAAFLRNPRSPDERIYKTGDLAKIGNDGLVYFLGRADSQIKSRGYRIELGEIEAALESLGALEECAVVAVSTDGFEGKQICCGYVALSGRDVSPLSLRDELGKTLPSYMLPSGWMALDRLPKNANGKIDRRWLREEFLQRESRSGDEASALSLSPA